MTPLIGIENLRLPHIQNFVQSDDTKLSIQDVGDLPRENRATAPVNDGYTIYKATGNAIARDIRSPEPVQPDQLCVPKLPGENPPLE